MTKRYASWVAHKAQWEGLPLLGVYLGYYRGKLTWEQWRRGYREARVKYGLIHRSRDGVRRQNVSLC